jgi:hypothetical protein
MDFSKFKNMGRIIRRPYRKHLGISNFKMIAEFRSRFDSPFLLE